VLGLRKGEVLGLCWQDVDLPNATLTVTQQLQRVGGRLLRRETKTEESDVELPLPGICSTALQLRQQWQRADQAAAGLVWQVDGLVFTTRYGTPIEPRNFNRSWTPAVRRPASGRSLFTTVAAAAAPCSPTWTCTLGWPCRSCGTRSSP
jgi:integrase